MTPFPEEDSVDSPITFVDVIFALTDAPPDKLNGVASRTEKGIVQLFAEMILESEPSQFEVSIDHVELEVWIETL